MSWDDQLMHAVGETKPLTTGDTRRWLIAVDKVMRSPALKTPVDFHPELILDSLRDVPCSQCSSESLRKQAMAETMSRNLLDDRPAALTRSKLLSKSKALSAARNIMHSYLGLAVMRNSTRETNVYQLELCRLKAETAQRLRNLERSRTQFLMAHCRRAQQPILAINRTPLITLGVEARCWRTTWTATAGSRRAPVDDVLYVPSYRKPRTVHSAPVKPTIDAFRRLTFRP